MTILWAIGAIAYAAALFVLLALAMQLARWLYRRVVPRKTSPREIELDAFSGYRAAPEKGQPFWGQNAWPVAWQLALGLALSFGLSWLFGETLYELAGWLIGPLFQS